ncbi:MAG TPA: hypothetical protein VK864_18040, partial [Longimicrobiales bacterium]|nr:hypothetical protein [Longimicrobiales bacterium]
MSFGALAYALLFVVVLPAGLVVWARATASAVVLPPVHAPAVGVMLVAIGALLWLAGVRELIVHGKGLPMNAYPPKQYVATGVYRYLAHP